ncbi:MAG: hypothetical protein EHM72_02480 [Calditrichaeota bacterium]|nr:MAG: hypothetical protein EHM72_02480 [Calditrichota bacterium]
MNKKSMFILTLLLTAASFAQTGTVNWQRSKSIPRDLELFHALYVSSLPTAETLQKGDLEFEVSHRFTTPVNYGDQTFAGLDGPANIRLSLGYAITQRWLVDIGRTNVHDNLELSTKYKILQIPHSFAPMLFSLRGGVAYNGQIYDPIKNDGRRFQYYGQLIANTLINNKIGIGLAPTYLYNAHIFCVEPQYSLTLGNYIQFYISPSWSLFVEWNPTVSGWRQDFNSIAAGIELETGGHFFKILLTNNDKINTAQVIAGADRDAAQGDLRLGFMITRLIK